jgi:hypothetical protein
MLVPQDSPCDECGHPRIDHEFTLEVWSERCLQCGCTIEVIPTLGEWNPDAPPRAYDWRFAIISFLMDIEDESLYTDTVHRWRPGFSLTAAEVEELRRVEVGIRDLWRRYSPERPRPASYGIHDVTAENESVDRFEKAKGMLWGVIARLAISDEWRSFFPEAEHPRIEALREVLIRHGAHLPPD